MNTLSCNIFIEHCHNHAVKSLEASNIQMVSADIKVEIKALISFGLTPSQVYNEFLRNLQNNSEDARNFHLKKADRFK